jgi:hypothetical protein
MRIPKAGIALALLIASTAWAQNTTTSLRGAVIDPQGAVDANVEVTLENPGEGFARNQKTDDRGEYQFLQIPPSTYTVSAVVAGFAASRKENVVLLVNTPATLNFALRVGAANSSVDVSAEATTVNTVDATIGNPFDSRQILALPSEGRNAVELLSLQAGVTYTGSQIDQATDSRGGAVNGARSDQTNITVDGLDNNDQLLGNAFTGVLRIPMDSLEEFRVTTAAEIRTCFRLVRELFRPFALHIRENPASETICAAQATSASTQVSPNSGRSRRSSLSAFPGMLLMSPAPCALM